MLKGYFAKISRNIVNTPYYNNATLLRAWMGLVLSVRFTPTVVDGIEVGINEVLVTKDGIAELFGVPKSRAYYVLKKMENDGLVTWLNIRNKYTLITLKEENFASLINRRIERPDGVKTSISIEEANNMSIDEELFPEDCNNESDTRYICADEGCSEAYDNKSEYEVSCSDICDDGEGENLPGLSDEGFETIFGYVPDTVEEKKRLYEEIKDALGEPYQDYDDDDDDDDYRGYYPKKKNYGYYKKNYNKPSGYKKSSRKESDFIPYEAYLSGQRKDYNKSDDYYTCSSPGNVQNTYAQKKASADEAVCRTSGASEVKSSPAASDFYGIYNPKTVPAKKSPEDNKMKFGEYSNVLLSRDEYNDLNMRLIKARVYIDELSSEIAKSHRKYDSHYQELLSRYKDELLTV